MQKEDTLKIFVSSNILFVLRVWDITKLQLDIQHKNINHKHKNNNIEIQFFIFTLTEGNIVCKLFIFSIC